MMDKFTPLILVLLVAGCAGLQTQPPARTLGVYSPSERVVDGQVVFSAEVALGGKGPEFTATGVNVRFLTAENRTMNTTSVGTITESNSSRQIRVRLASAPSYVLLEVDTVSTEGEYAIRGLRRDESGTYHPFIQSKRSTTESS